MSGGTFFPSVVRVVARRPVLPVLLAALALFAITGWVAPAAAHANLVLSDPSAGAVLAAAPKQVQLWFSEQPDPHFSDVEVLDARRQPVDAGDMHPASGDQLSLIVGVKPDLPDGLYTIAWKTVSAVDGHVVNGTVPFYVGQPPQGTVLPSGAQAGPTSSGSGPIAASVLVRWLSLASAVVLMGGFAFCALVLIPSLAALRVPRPGPGAMAARTAVHRPLAGVPPAVARRADLVLLAAWLMLVLATITALLQQLQAASGADIQHLFGSPLRTLLLQTRYGHVWWLRAAATASVGAVLFIRPRTSVAGASASLITLLGALAVEAVFVSYSLNSHAAALTSGSTLATSSDLLHLTAVGLWIGGLVQLALLTPPLLRSLDAADHKRYLAGAVPRFSTLAIVCVTTLAGTGVYQAVRELPGWAALWETGWGRTLGVKLVILIPLLSLGAVNLLVLRPALVRSAEAPARETDASPSPPRALRLERGFLAAVVAESLLGLAILLVVGVLVNQPPPGVNSGATTPGIHLSSNAAGVTVKLTITPGQLGPNHLDALADDHGKPTRDGTQLVLRLTYKDADLGTSEVTTKAEGKGHFVADTSDLSTYGRWQILALVQPPAADEVRTEFSISVTNEGSSGSGTEARGDTSIKKGQQLFLANCAQCHGNDARGDGPQAKLLDPPPADLRQHVPQHTDQQLLDWIANGIPATAMPAFGQKLSRQDREAVLNYLRNLTRDLTPTPCTVAPTAAP